MSTSAVELERLVIKLVGEGSEYQKTLDDAVRQTNSASKELDRITMDHATKREMAMQEVAQQMSEGKRVMEAMRTPTERYKDNLNKLNELHKVGAIDGRTWGRAVKANADELHKASGAYAKAQQRIEKRNAALAAGRRITESVRTPTAMYRRELVTLNRAHREGTISSATHGKALARLNREYQMGSFAVKRYGQSIGAVGRRMTGMGTRMMLGITLPIAGTVAAYGKFDSAMVKSLSIMGDVSDDMKAKMADTARSLALDGASSATQLAEAYYFLASAGLDAQQSISALSAVQKFSTAGSFDLALATDLLTDAQSALGLASKDAEMNMKGMVYVSDIMVKASTLANASVQQFAEALTNDAGAAINQLGMDLEEGMAILAAYADQGIKGNVAGSLLARMTRLLSKAINDNRDAFDEMNIPYQEFAETGKNLKGIIGGLTTALHGMGPAAKAATLEKLGFRAQSQQAILPLLGLTEKIEGYEEALREAGGITEEVANKQLKSFSVQMRNLWNHVTELAMSIGEKLSPTLMKLSETVKGLLRWWNKLSDGTKTTVAWFLVTIAVVGPLIIILGFLALGISSIVTLMGMMGVASFAAFGSMLLLSAKVVAIFLLVAISIWACADALTETELGFNALLETIKIGGVSISARLSLMASRILENWDALVIGMSMGWDLFASLVAEGAAKVWRGVLYMGKGIADAAWWMVGKVADSVGWLVEKSANIMRTLGIISGDTVDSIKNQIDEISNHIERLGDAEGKAYQESIDASLTNTEKRWEKHAAEIARLDKEQDKNTALWKQARWDIVKEDQKEYAGNASIDKMAELTELFNSLTSPSEILEDLDGMLDDMIDTDDLKDEIDDLLKTLADPASAIEGLDKMTRGFDNVADGIHDVVEMNKELNEVNDALSGKASLMAIGVGGISGVKPPIGKDLDTSTKNSQFSAMDEFNEILKALSDPVDVVNGLDGIAEGLGDTTEGLDGMVEGLDDMTNGLDGISKALDNVVGVVNGLDDASKAIDEVVNITKHLGEANEAINSAIDITKTLNQLNEVIAGSKDLFDVDVDKSFDIKPAIDEGGIKSNHAATETTIITDRNGTTDIKRLTQLDATNQLLESIDRKLSSARTAVAG